MMERNVRPAALAQRAVVAIAVALGIGVSSIAVRAELSVDEITLDYVAGLPPLEGTDAANRVGDEVLVRAAAACARSSEGTASACWEAKLLTAFDHDNHLQGHCKAGTSDFGICVTIGAEVVAMFMAFSVDPEAEMDWTDLSASFSKADQRLRARAEELCIQGGAGGSPECITIKSVELFGGSHEAGEKCADRPGLAETFRCIANVRAAYLYGLALRSLGE
jgi:hypothetical protein